MATTPLIVDFPNQRNSRRSLQFAETSQLYIYKRPIPNPHELWYTQPEYDMMKLAAGQEVLQVREARTTKEAPGQDVCLMGIEHLLTPACRNEARACRFRCSRAVLAEQANMRATHAASSVSWGAIALASCAEIRKAVLRARKFGKLHRDSAARSF